MKAIKKCKGTGKAKGYGCGNENHSNTSLHYGLCDVCWRDFLIKSDYGKQLMSKAVNKAKKELKKEITVKIKETKIKNQSIASLIAEVKVPFQKLIRIRDHRKMCICCPDQILPYNIGEYDAGHYFKAEVYTGLIFNPNNVHGQRVYCNQHLNGNEAKYTVGLIKRLGQKKYDDLVELSIKYKSYKWDRQVLIEMKKHYCVELKAVESGKKDIKDVDFTIGILK